MLQEYMSEEESDGWFMANRNKDEWFKDHTDFINRWRMVPHTKTIVVDELGQETKSVVYVTEGLIKDADGFWHKTTRPGPILKKRKRKP